MEIVRKGDQKSEYLLHENVASEKKIACTDEKISERDRFEFPAKIIFANNSKIINWRTIYNVSSCSKKENGPKDT